MTIAISAMNATSMAPTARAMCIPESAPDAAASKRFTLFMLSRSSSSARSFFGDSVSGMTIFAMRSPPGAAIKQAAIRYFSSMPMAA